MVETPTIPCRPKKCPPRPKPPCPAVCPPPPPPPSCRVKPMMRGLHWAQTKRRLTEAILASICGGLLVYLTYTRPRMQRYKEFYALAEFEDWGEEMAKKGLFQAVPKESAKEK